jgi:alpha-tubulin suppressor-like RCC1 family protein
MLANQVKKATFAQTQVRNFASAVYLWRNASRYAGKSGSASAKFEMPRGLPKRIEAFDDLNVKTLRVGARHSAVICENGNLYTFGSANWGALGHGTENFVSFNKPKLVEHLAEANVKVKDVHLGEYHTMVLGEDGSVWTWGYGGKKGMFNWMYN